VAQENVNWNSPAHELRPTLQEAIDPVRPRPLACAGDGPEWMGVTGAPPARGDRDCVSGPLLHRDPGAFLVPERRLGSGELH
jgi:hypothetical protein